MKETLNRIFSIPRNFTTCLRPYYITRPQLWSRDIRRGDSRVAVSTKWRYGYVRIPKAANMTIMRTLLHHFPEEENARKRGYWNQFKNPRQLSWAETRQMESEYFIFTVVRNPYHRVLSAFLDKFEGGGDYGQKYYSQVRTYDNGQLTFQAFCRYLKDGGAYENRHWMPQAWQLAIIGFNRFDFIGKVESLEYDLQHVIKKIGYHSESIDLVKANHPGTQAVQRATDWYNDECMSLVREVFKEDFDLFNYPSDRF